MNLHHNIFWSAVNSCLRAVYFITPGTPSESIVHYYVLVAFLCGGGGQVGTVINCRPSKVHKKTVRCTDWVQQLLGYVGDPSLLPAVRKTLNLS